jgi:hypothetical protein
MLRAAGQIATAPPGALLILDGAEELGPQAGGGARFA